MKIVTKNSLTISNVNDGTITHTAYANSADGTDSFTTVYPNLNLLDGTKDFSGNWLGSALTDGTYKGLTVKKQTNQWGGIHKTFTAPKDGTYTFSAYVKSSGNNANINRWGQLNGIGDPLYKPMGNNFDWTRDSITLNLKANDSVDVRYEISTASTDSILWTAGHKWEPGSIATPYMPSASEVKTADWPSYIGQYSDFTQADSTNPSNYTWSLIRGNDGKDGADGKDGIAGKDGVGIKTTDITYAISTSGTTAPTTGWTSSVPSLVKGQYLWTKTVWTYTDNSSETGYSVTYISKDGNDGNDGIAGKDGVGIKLTTITYAKSTSGTTQPTTGWTSTVPTVPAGQFLWTKTVWDYTDSTSETGYSVAKMGDNGTDGKDGNDGKTYYPHTAYAYSADGKEGFTTLYPHLNLEQHTEMLVDDSNKLLYGGKGSATATMTHEYVSIPGLPTVKNAVHVTQIAKGQSGWRSPLGSFSVVGGTTYTVSAYVKNNGTETIRLGLYLGVSAQPSGSSQKYLTAYQDVKPSKDFVLYTQNIEVPAGYSYGWSYVYTKDITISADWSFAGLKVEAGETQTLWMPHESDVTSKDYPTYIGTYTDTYYNGSDDPSKYSWALFRGEDGEKGDSGEPGKVVQQDKEPTERFKDMLWQYTGTEPLDVAGITAQPNMTYVWNGSAWQIWFLNPANLQAVNAWITNAMIANAAIDFAKINSATIKNLSAVNSILGDVKAGKITNEFEYDSSVGKTKGTLVIDEIGLRMDYVENGDKTKPGSVQVSPSGMMVSRYNTEGVRETASYTQKGMVMSSDVLPMKLSWQGITATVNYERSFDVVYITGRGNWGKFEAGKERSFTGLPESVWPQYEIASGASSMGGAQNMAAKITTDGRIGITSSVSKDNCYAGFSITYRARPNVS